jgi:hypothetical protein
MSEISLAISVSIHIASGYFFSNLAPKLAEART